MYDVQIDAIAHFKDPLEWWANLDDCGDFPCTGPANSLWTFVNTKFYGKIPELAIPNFSLISNNPGVGPFVPSCIKYLDMNGYYCQNNFMGILMFES